MKNIKPLERALFVDILMVAFRTNPSVVQLTGSGETAEQKLRRLMIYAFEQCYDFGKVVQAEEGQGCALILFPDRIRFSFRSLIRDLNLVFKVIGLFKLLRVIRKEQLLKRLRPSHQLYYVWFIGVSPLYQGRGIGSSLLDELCADAQRMNRMICLETSVEENVSWYVANGFQMYDVRYYENFRIYLLSH